MLKGLIALLFLAGAAHAQDEFYTIQPGDAGNRSWHTVLRANTVLHIRHNTATFLRPNRPSVRSPDMESQK
jgi:hypothetical protein